ncbi:MAG: hypothetical protein GX029_14240 [Pseudomonadaceae bacterium]|nr:hypothetical protein [Pseudomonadaceae bacterium]
MAAAVTESEKAKALKEIFEDWEETNAEEESAYDCSLKEAKALAADLAALQQVDDNDYGPDEYEEWRKAVRAELEAESEAEAERGYY